MTEELKLDEAKYEESVALVKTSTNFVIESVEDQNVVQSRLDTFKTNEKLADEVLQPRIDALNRKKKRLTELKARMKKPNIEGYGICKKQLMDWEKEQERQIAEKQVENQKAVQDAVDDVRMAQAVSVAASEGDDAAQAILSAPMATPIAPTPTISRAKGIRRTKNYYAHIKNIRVMMQGVIQGSIPLPDDIDKDKLASVLGLNRLAKALKGAAKYPGVEVRFTEK